MLGLIAHGISVAYSVHMHRPRSRMMSTPIGSIAPMEAAQLQYGSALQLWIGACADSAKKAGVAIDHGHLSSKTGRRARSSRRLTHCEPCLRGGRGRVHQRSISPAYVSPEPLQRRCQGAWPSGQRRRLAPRSAAARRPSRPPKDDSIDQNYGCLDER